jgi:MFS family permease
MRAPAALREREFRLLFTAQTVSLFGDAVAPVALAFAVLDQTHSASALGYALAARTATLIVFILVGGVWADRVSQQRLMVASDALRFGSQGLLASLMFIGHAGVWQIVVLQAFNGAGSAFFRPAFSALIPQTVTPDQLQEANGLLHVVFSAAWMVGPAVAGTIVAALGSASAIAFDAGTFAVSALFLLAMRTPPLVRPQRQKFLSELLAGWREVRIRSWIWISLSTFALFNVVWGPFWVLGPVIQRQHALHGRGAVGWATIIAALGAGSVVGSLVSTRVKPHRPLLIAHAVTLSAAPTFVALGLASPVLVVAACTFLMGLALAVANTLWETALQANVPQESLSRVSAYDWVASTAFNPIGTAAAGPAAVLIGNRATLVTAAVTIVAVQLAALSFGSIRNFHQPATA